MGKVVLPLAYNFGKSAASGAGSYAGRALAQGIQKAILGTANPQPQYATKRYVQALIKNVHEKKYAEISSGIVEISYDTPLIFQASVTSQGDSDTTRDGDKINIKSITIQGYVQADSAADDFTHVRLILFQYLPDETPTGPDIIDATGSALTSFSSIAGNFNHDNKKNYRILRDKKIMLPGSTTAKGLGTIPTRKVFKMYYNFGLGAKRNDCKNVIQYKAGSSTDAVNNIYLIAISSYSDASTMEPVISIRSKLNYMG